MLTLITFPATEDDLSLSSFCNKAICLLELSGLDWQRSDVPSPSKTPYGKLPVLRDGDQTIPETEFIKAHLETLGARFDAHLTPEQHAQSHALVRMVEESLRYGMMYDRWIDDRCWPLLRKAAFAGLPAPVRMVLPGVLRRNIRRMLNGIGLGRLSAADRQRKLSADLDALHDALGDQPFMFGPSPTSADAAIVPVLHALRMLPADTDLRRRVRSDVRLCAYIDRGQVAFYPGFSDVSAAA